MMKYGAYCLFLLALGAPVLAQSNNAPNAGYKDTRAREYLTPSRIVWVSGEDAIENLDGLLLPGNGQADLVGNNLTTIRGAEQNPAFIVDFGKEIHGGVQLVTGMFDGNEPIHVGITLGESVSEAMSSVKDPDSTATNDHAMREFDLALPWLGRIEVGNSGFRFARIELLDKDRILKLKEFNAISIYRDIPYLGSFKSNDERLNEIWRTGAYTVHLNMQDYLWDGIKRDQLVWVGDMHPEVMTIKSVFGNNEVVPKSLDFIRGITELPEWMNGLSSYSIWWVLIQHEWYKGYGNLTYLQKHQDYIFDLLDLLATKIDENGKETLDGRFLDWPTRGDEAAVHAGLQGLMAMAFQTGIELTEILDEPSRRPTYEEALTRLKKHVPDSNGSKSAAALLSLSGLMDAQEVNEKWLAKDPLKGISTFYGYYVLQARAKAGDYQGALDVIRQYWGAMLDLGATTFWEDFDIAWAKNASRIDEVPTPDKDDVHADFGNHVYVGYRHSLCHGWASGPTAWLTEHVLGISVVDNGNAVKIAPNLGDLTWVEGSFPTKFGVLHVRHEKNEDGSISTEIQNPAGLIVQ